MSCISPYYLEEKKIFVPCGNCLACRIARTSVWAMRLLHELDYHKCACFPTLTYSPDHLPSDYGLHKRDFQLFMKRLRKSTSIKLKYLACGEYGDKYGRPHYHAIIFGLSNSPADTKLIEDAWALGQVKNGTATHDSMQYVAGYIQKKLTGKLAESHYTTRQAPFNLMSQGLGRLFALDNIDRIKQQKKLTVKGKPVPVPKYYRNICGLTGDDFLELALESQQKMYEYHISRMQKNAEKPNSYIQNKYGKQMAISPSLYQSQQAALSHLKASARQKLDKPNNNQL